MRQATPLLALCLLACGVTPSTDAGPDTDGGALDAAPRTDAGSDDAGQDGGSDGGSVDAGEPERVPCDSTDAEVYAATPGPEGTPPGTVLRCSTQPSISQDAMDTSVDAEGVEVTSGAARFLIAYQTERQPGVAGVGSAVVLIPDSPIADAPLVAVAHGTAGHADVCAPSTQADLSPNLVLPWAASGMPTVAMDYAGLGTAGIQGYGDAFDTSQSVLDAARAALRLMEDDRDIVLVGHSQGGGASLSAQGLAATYAPELRIARSVAIAGGSAGGLELTPAQAPFLGLLNLRGGGGATRAFVAMTLYADLANRLGEERALEGFAEGIRSTIQQSMERDCIFAMAVFLNTPRTGYVPPNTLGQLLDSAFLAGVRDCITESAGCTPEAQAFVDQRTERSFIPADPDAGGVLLIGGAADTIFPPNAFGCLIESVDATGTTRETCFLDGATHASVVPEGMATAIAYALDGTTTCPTSATTVPVCE